MRKDISKNSGELSGIYKALEALELSEEERAKREAEWAKMKADAYAGHQEALAKVKPISREEYNRRKKELNRRINAAGIIYMDAMGWDGRDVDFSLSNAKLPPPTCEEILKLDSMDRILDIIERTEIEYPSEQLANDIHVAKQRTKAYGKMIDYLLRARAIDKNVWDILHHAYVPNVDMELLYHIYQGVRNKSSITNGGSADDRKKMVDELLCRRREKTGR